MDTRMEDLHGKDLTLEYLQYVGKQMMADGLNLDDYMIYLNRQAADYLTDRYTSASTDSAGRSLVGAVVADAMLRFAEYRVGMALYDNGGELGYISTPAFSAIVSAYLPILIMLRSPGPDTQPYAIITNYGLGSEPAEEVKPLDPTLPPDFKPIPGPSHVAGSIGLEPDDPRYGQIMSVLDSVSHHG